MTARLHSNLRFAPARRLVCPGGKPCVHGFRETLERTFPLHNYQMHVVRHQTVRENLNVTRRSSTTQKI